MISTIIWGYIPWFLILASFHVNKDDIYNYLETQSGQLCHTGQICVFVKISTSKRHIRVEVSLGFLVCESERLGCNADFYTVSRWRTRGESKDHTDERSASIEWWLWNRYGYKTRRRLQFFWYSPFAFVIELLFVFSGYSRKLIRLNPTCKYFVLVCWTQGCGGSTIFQMWASENQTTIWPMYFRILYENEEILVDSGHSLSPLNIHQCRKLLVTPSKLPEECFRKSTCNVEVNDVVNNFCAVLRINAQKID